jgi:hypothetical protein
VSVGDVADTAEFAVESIRRWWNQMGRRRFPEATTLMITADAGGSNGLRVRAWKYHLARPALSGLGWVTVVKGTTAIAALGKNLFLAGSTKGTKGHSSSPSCATALASPERSGSRWTSTRHSSSAAPPSARVSIGPSSVAMPFASGA